MRNRHAVWLSVPALLVAAVAHADGVRVLDELESARSELQVAVGAAQARTAEILDRVRAPDADRVERRALLRERGALRKLLAPGSAALRELDAAIPALRRNDFPEFVRAATRAAARLQDAADAGAGIASDAWALDPRCMSDLSAALRQALDEARVLAGAAVPETTEAQLAAGAKRDAAGAYDRACAVYLREMGRIAGTPLAVDGHLPVVLVAGNGQPVNLALSVAPYSPRRTCGTCHDYDTITKGFHFDQGRSAIRDDYSVGRDGTPGYVLSDGMFGKW